MIIMVFEKLLKIGFLTIKRKWMMEWVLKKWKLNRNEFQRDFSVFNSDQVQKMIPIKLNSLEPQMNDLNYRFSWKEFDLNQKWTTSSLRWMIWITGLVIKILFELKGEKFKKNSKKTFQRVIHLNWKGLLMLMKKIDLMLCMNVKMVEPFIIQMCLMWMQKLLLMHKNNDDEWMYERCKWIQ